MVIELEFSGMSKCAKPSSITCRLLNRCGDAEKVFVAKEFPQIQGEFKSTKAR
jgi:hypothetical protein